MVIKIKAVIVCDDCAAEVDCEIPMEFGSPAWSCVFKRPELPEGRIITEHYGHEEQKYLCNKCAKARGYDGDH